MTDEELNRYVHEVIHGEGSWFNFSNDGERLPQPNYLEHGKPWGELLNWARKQKWWEAFKFSQWYNDDGGGIEAVIASAQVGLPIELFSNPRSLPEHIAEYLKREGGRWK